MTTLSKSIVVKIGELLSQDSNKDKEKQWLIQSTDDRLIKQALSNLKTQDIHVIATINEKNQVHIKELPQLTKLSQPTISRMITNLEKENIVEKYRTTKNNKDILVRLTNNGYSIAKLHKLLEQNIEIEVQKILDKYSDKTITDFLLILEDIRKIMF